MSKQKYKPTTSPYELGEKISKAFKKFGINIEISDCDIISDRVCYKVKLKGNTRETQVRSHVPDVKLNLKLPLLHIVREDLTLYLIASENEIEHDRLPKILESKVYEKVSKRMCLPYIVGHGPFGELVIIDLGECPHLLLGGSTNSGKSVSMQALIVCFAYNTSSAEVNFILIDVGANNLRPFEGLPHLAYPIVSDRTTAIHTLTALTDEMERRIELEGTDPIKYDRLPMVGGRKTVFLKSLKTLCFQGAA